MRRSPTDLAPRIGAVSYANATPLTHCLPDLCPAARVFKDVPSALTPLLLRREVDVALIPVADLFAHPELEFIEGVGICAESHVESVVLRCNRPVHDVRTVWLDPASRTSNALAALLLRRHYGLDPETRYPDDGPPPDAEVVIGDRAMCTPPGRCGDLDLAAVWHRMTGLPFVFAVWAHRAERPAGAELVELLHAARRTGLEAIEEIVRIESRRLGLPEARCRDYFTRSIRYQMGPREAEGMRRFREMIEQTDGGA